jgi:hypothetical protein
MPLIIAGFHVIFEAMQGPDKRDTLHKYIYISDDWDSIIKFYEDGATRCANYFFYYLVELDKEIDMRFPTCSFSIKNAHQMPYAIAMHHFSQEIVNLKKPDQLCQSELRQPGALYFYQNGNTSVGILSKKPSDEFLKPYEIQKENIYTQTVLDLKNNINQMSNYRDFYVVESTIRKYSKMIQKVSFNGIDVEPDKTICINQISGFSHL